MAFVTPVVEHWLEREIAQWVHNNYHTMSRRSTTELHFATNFTLLNIYNK